MRRRGTGRDAGFTLIEVLVSLALLGLLTTLVFGGVRFGAQAWTAASRSTSAAADLEAARAVLRRTIAAAYPAYASASLVDRTVAFEGTEGDLALVAPLPAAIEAGVLAVQRFRVAQDENGPALVMEWQLYLPASEGGRPLEAKRVKLLGGVGSVRFSYFGAPAPRQPPAWLDRWTERASLPSLVRVHLEPADAELSRWPELMVELRATANTACVYDPGELTCRRIR